MSERQGTLTAVEATDSSALVARAREYADRVLRPNALATDADGLTAQTIADLRDLGLLNHLAPAAYGGADVDRSTDRRLNEVIAGACFNTWLVWAQHTPTVTRLKQWQAEHPEREHPLVERILRGEVFAGTAVSDVRRYPARYLAARRGDGGWIFDGSLSWVSGWGLSSVIAVAAVDPRSERVVLALVPVSDRTVASPLDLSVVDGSLTERVDLHGVPVPDEDVLAVHDLDEWRAIDRANAGEARPHHFGLARTVLDELAAEPEPTARELAAAWRPRIERIRERAYALSDLAAASEAPDELHPEERLALVVAGGDALLTLTQALVVARSGRGLARDDTAQLHARSALFALVQAQSPAIRAAQLRDLTRPLREETTR